MAFSTVKVGSGSSHDISIKIFSNVNASGLGLSYRINPNNTFHLQIKHSIPQYHTTMKHIWSGFDTATTSTDDNLIEHDISKNQVESFLEEYPYLKALLPEIENAIYVYFGDYQKLSYDVFQDPESHKAQLLIEIISDYVLDESLTRLENFDRQWWIQYSNKLNNLILIDIGFE